MTTMAPTAAESEAEAIREAGTDWLAAVDTRDAARVAPYYAADGLFLVPNVPRAHGREAVQAVWAQLLSAPNLELAWTPTSIEMAQAADMAYEVGSYRLAMDVPNGRVEDDGKYVVVWRKTAEGWKVAADIFNSSRPLSA